MYQIIAQMSRSLLSVERYGAVLQHCNVFCCRHWARVSAPRSATFLPPPGTTEYNGSKLQLELETKAIRWLVITEKAVGSTPV